jgi:DNA-binding NtrC family response regulator
LICATNRDLEREVRDGRFRPDLYYRIADRTLHLPSLRARREDILSLAKYFWRVSRPSDEDPDFDPALSQYLVARDYPGNVRDLRRIIVALRDRHAGGSTVTIGALPESERPSVPVAGAINDDPAPSPSTDPWATPGFLSAIGTAIARGDDLREIGRAAAAAAIRLALDQEDGNLPRAARLLGVTDRALQARRKNGEAVSLA